MRKIATTLFYFIIFFVTCSIALAFDMDTKGTDFWLTFPPNFHNNKTNGIDYLRLGDSLYIFITSDEVTSGNIEYTDLSGNIYNKNFTISDPTQIYIFKVCYLDYELIGYNDNGIFGSRNHSERTKKQYFHITSDNEVTVYAHSQSNKTSDACIVLPTDILGKDYFVISYKSDGEVDTFFGNLTGSSTPSQFVILGTQDNTNVTIYPKAETEYNGNSVQNIIINKGDSYLVQAKIDKNNLNLDLTGTEIKSDKPIAVFAGHQRSNLPIISRSSPSRDFLFEEMPPIETWGKNALLVPYVQPTNLSKYGTDLFRILSAYDNTEIYINGIYTTRLGKGEFYEGQLTQSGLVESSAPVLVAQFKKTSDYGAGTIMGDPFEMLIPPVEQFMNNYKVFNTQAMEYDGDWFGQPIFQKVYIQQFLTIVAPNSALDSVLLDGGIIARNNFTSIPSSTFSYANMSVSDGVHTISCNDKIGVYVYGYGAANSYGYVGGMYLRAVDFQPPLVTGLDSCFSISGMVYDSSSSDSRLKSISSPFQSQINVNVNIENFVPYKKSVGFKARLLNFYQDGEFDIVAIDSVGLKTTQKFEIPGFTLSVKDYPDASFLPEHKKLYRIGKEFCMPIVIENYGKHRQNINGFVLSNNTNFRVVYNKPKILNPGQSDTAFICFNSPVDADVKDTLSLIGDCGERKIQAFDLQFRGDTNKPSIMVTPDPCNKEFIVGISDSTILDYGLASVDIIDTINCNVTIENYLPAFERVRILVIDPYKDAIYHLSATDSSGLVNDIIDTIQGFTVKFTEIADGIKSFIFDSTVIGDINCRELEISNTGLLPITFDENMFFKKNIIFSLPPAQLPLILIPGESKKLTICFSPLMTASGFQDDTLVFRFNCLDMKLNIIGVGKPRIEVAGNKTNNKCSVPVKLTFNEIPQNNFLGNSYPNPAVDNVSIKFGITEKGKVEIDIFDLLGNKKLIVISELLEPGIYEVKFNTDMLVQGVYFYTLSSQNNIITRSFVISK